MEGLIFGILRYFMYFLVCHQYRSTLSFKIISVTLQIGFRTVKLTNFSLFFNTITFPCLE